MSDSYEKIVKGDPKEFSHVHDEKGNAAHPNAGVTEHPEKAAKTGEPVSKPGHAGGNVRDQKHIQKSGMQEHLSAPQAGEESADSLKRKNEKKKFDENHDEHKK